MVEQKVKYFLLKCNEVESIKKHKLQVIKLITSTLVQYLGHNENRNQDRSSYFVFVINTIFMYLKSYYCVSGLLFECIFFNKVVKEKKRLQFTQWYCIHGLRTYMYCKLNQSISTSQPNHMRCTVVVTTSPTGKKAVK